MDPPGICLSGRNRLTWVAIFLMTAALADCTVYDDSLLELGHTGTAAGPPAIVASTDGRGGASPALEPTPSGSGSATAGAVPSGSGGGAIDEPPDASGDAPSSMDEVTTYPDAAPSVDGASDSATPLKPILHYKFDETTGNMITDSSGNAHAGTVSGTHTWVAGHVGNACAFDGTSAFASAPAGIVSTLTAITIATWVEVDAASNWQRILDFGNSSMVYMLLTPKNSTTGTLRFAITVSGATGEQVLDGSSALPVGVWKHVAVVLDGQRASLYVDGALESFKNSFTMRPIDIGATQNNWLGRSEYAVDPYFKGKLDDFRIYDRALTAVEVASIAHP